MPVSDIETYPAGHFDRVFEHLIVPACQDAGFEPILGSRIQTTNFIVLDIIKRILNAEMTVCDLSGRNGNVLCELGLRQAFNGPVTLIKDRRTQRIFDIQGIQDVEYDESLRVDSVKVAMTELTETIPASGAVGFACWQVNPRMQPTNTDLPRGSDDAAPSRENRF
jgi:hypothetical protein